MRRNARPRAYPERPGELSWHKMVQATIILEDMMKTEYLRKEWRYWSSTSTAARIYNVSALALQNYILDASVRIL
ncbi:hypothetical protein L2E82_29349 [Cichorium intybus]|uniref:Uncharacterized protein n=1 Tax=Cichorium intybus TaxID=13427 RepID=A0ACB9CXI7_CICIN|nr:hypothetical protein L2E82_29349 [Cichorium intybus]